MTGPSAAEVTDALAGRASVTALPSDLPAASRAALSGIGDFFNTPVESARLTGDPLDPMVTRVDTTLFFQTTLSGLAGNEDCPAADPAVA
jgi:hypothetical protein